MLIKIKKKIICFKKWIMFWFYIYFYYKYKVCGFVFDVLSNCIGWDVILNLED